MSTPPRDLKPGACTELGATYDGDGVNFAVFSASAERVEVCLFDENGAVETERLELPEYTDEIFHGYVPGLKPGQRYGLRAHGVFDPEAGHRFNANKLLMDPYARQISGELAWNPAHFGYDMEAGDDRDLTFSQSDSAPFTPKCVVTAPDRICSSARAPTAWEETVIYEAHVRGFTMRFPGLDDEARGTFDGMADARVVDYVKSLGVTAVELLPVHYFPDDQHLAERGLRNYWGYNSLGFFAPAARYMGKSGVASFRNMTRAFHDAGIEVFLDVVYNHTAEGNELGPTLSFKGLDNFSYYRTIAGAPRYYVNDSGAGNTVNLSHPRVLQMVMDSLRYWVSVMEVDGFRFDLGTILGREPDGFDQRGGFFDAIGQDPTLRGVKLIGEPWDIGPGGYQVGGFPPGWSEWNDKYRDTVRGFWRGDGGLLRDLAARVTGSGDIYDQRGRRPWAGVNFVTAHDGFTLHDLVSYNNKHNEANGEDNNDGHNHNLSMNHGVEGETDDPAIIAAREQHKRSLLATLLLSHGAPMLLSGDEHGHSSHGNNNVYCQDNETAWLRWDELGPAGAELTEFVRSVIQLRAGHPIFRRASFRDACELLWLNPAGGFQLEEQWDDVEQRVIGLWMHMPDGDRGGDEALLLFNGGDAAAEFVLPARKKAGEWTAVLDTATPHGKGTETVLGAGASTQRPPRSLLVLM